ncbi:MAG TPA: hypothetical protein VGX25_04405 [Actinophytocola sp.]|uniref:hypothetical protein n=1 Tax=Actinophytocola sp. TaxID=1872138 RepID=UPI002DDDB5BF|nr:hypothetical protein [Actinophytocola sp.]HEV2778622.1 hypothetical protein [Actinophytocola sp.]
MSTRTRSRARPAARSYTARLHDRTAKPLPTRRLPAWIAATVALCAELGHLAAAGTEWPASMPRGLVHVVAAAALGLVAANVYFGPNRLIVRAAMTLGLALPALWLTGAVAGFPLYRDFPIVAAGALAAVELGLAGLSAHGLRRDERGSRPRPAGARRG